MGHPSTKTSQTASQPSNQIASDPKTVARKKLDAAQLAELAEPLQTMEELLSPAELAQDDESAKPREKVDRRKSVVDMRNDPTGLERRRGPGRRRSDFAKSAEEGEMSPEQFLFIMAIDAYKRVNQKPFPTWTEVLEVIRKLGYRKTSASELQLPNAEDWTEAADAVAFVPKAAKESDDSQILDEE